MSCWRPFVFADYFLMAAYASHIFKLVTVESWFSYSVGFKQDAHDNLWLLLYYYHSFFFSPSAVDTKFKNKYLGSVCGRKNYLQASGETLDLNP